MFSFDVTEFYYVAPSLSDFLTMIRDKKDIIEISING